MGANDGSTSGGPERLLRLRRKNVNYDPGQYTEDCPARPRGTLCSSPGPEWDAPPCSDSGARERSRPKPKKPRPRPKSAPPTHARASHATFRPIAAERPQSAPPFMTLSAEEVDETITGVEMELWTDHEHIAKMVAEFEELLAQ